MNRLPALFLCTVTCVAAAQQAARPEPAFEVATINNSMPRTVRLNIGFCIRIDNMMDVDISRTVAGLVAQTLLAAASTL